jgi:AcrR family transcriptional regulator
MDGVKARRRGGALEEAILDAAWTELVEHGYPGMMLDAVAKRAGTSRPVLSRRWPSRIRLATAALARHMVTNPIDVPDLGSVSAELRRFLRGLADRARPDLIRLVFDMSGDLAAANSSMADVRAEFVNNRLMSTIIDRGIARREIDPDRLTPRILALPTDLVRHDLLMTLKPPSDVVIQEIVDDIFLPLVSRDRLPRRSSG